MSQRTRVIGPRRSVILLLIVVALVVAAGVALGVFVLLPQRDAAQHYQAGLAFESAGEWEAARQEYMQVIGIDAAYKDTQARLAEVKTRLAEGVAAATAVAAAGAERAQATAQAEATDLARATVEAQALADATAEAALTATAEAFEQRYQRALGLINLEEWLEAQAELQAIFDTDPNYRDVQAQLALVNEQLAKLTPTHTPIPDVTLTPTPVPPPLHLYTDESWRTYHNESPNWETVSFDDSRWLLSSVVTYGEWSQLQGMDRNAKWIWNPNAILNAPVFFRREFSVSASPYSATLRISADNVYRVFVNGNYVGEDNNWMQAEVYVITPYLAPGSNVIAVQVVDKGVVGGLIAWLAIEY